MFDWFKKKTQISPDANEPTIRVYLNPLHAMLYAAEKQKDARLTEEEVLHVRDTTVSMDMSASQSAKFYASFDSQVNVYRMNPNRIWEEWQEIRDQVQG